MSADPTQTTPDHITPEIPEEVYDEAWEKAMAAVRRSKTERPGGIIGALSSILAVVQPVFYAAHRKQVEAEVRGRLLTDALIDRFGTDAVAAVKTARALHMDAEEGGWLADYEAEALERVFSRALDAALDTLEADRG